jgi:anti-anti-sigma factor
MEIRPLDKHSALVITPSHDLALEGVPPVDEAIRRAFRREVDTVIMDLSGVEHVDSSGISVLVKGHQAADKQGKKLVLIRLRPNVRRIFRLSNLHKVFDIFNSLDDVLFTLEDHSALFWDTRRSVVDFYEELLTANGFAFQVAGDRREAEQILERDSPSVVILDVRQDEKEKYEFVRESREREGKGGVPVVVVSSFLEEESSYLDAGVSLFVSKPFRVESLVRELRDLARNRVE